jgi:hypothetical protein
LLHELLPEARIAALVDPNSAESATQLSNVQDAARTICPPGSTESQLDDAFATLARERPDALVVVLLPSLPPSASELSSWRHAGLAIAVYLFEPAKYHGMLLVEVFYQMLKWGLGPELVDVYISYYLDRQTCHDLPDIKHSYSTLGWRLLNCIGFAATTVFLLLPPLLALEAQPGAAWDSATLRFVASGTTFFVARACVGRSICSQEGDSGDQSRSHAPTELSPASIIGKGTAANQLVWGNLRAGHP